MASIVPFVGIYQTRPYKVSGVSFKGILEKNIVSTLKSPVRVRPDNNPQVISLISLNLKRFFFPVLFVGGSLY